MSNFNQLSGAIRFALLAGAASTFAAVPAFAQDTTTETEATELDTIEVTGSRLKRAEIEGAVPVVVIDRAQIDASGDVSVADVLRDSTFASFGVIKVPDAMPEQLAFAVTAEPAQTRWVHVHDARAVALAVLARLDERDVQPDIAEHEALVFADRGPALHDPLELQRLRPDQPTVTPALEQRGRHLQPHPGLRRRRERQRHDRERTGRESWKQHVHIRR